MKKQDLQSMNNMKKSQETLSPRIFLKLSSLARILIYIYIECLLLVPAFGQAKLKGIEDKAEGPGELVGELRLLFGGHVFWSRWEDNRIFKGLQQRCLCCDWLVLYDLLPGYLVNVMLIFFGENMKEHFPQAAVFSSFGLLFGHGHSTLRPENGKS